MHHHEWYLRFALGDSDLKIEPIAYCKVCGKVMLTHKVEERLRDSEKWKEACEEALEYWQAEWRAVLFHRASRFRKEVYYYQEILGVTGDVEKDSPEIAENS